MMRRAGVLMAVVALLGACADGARPAIAPTDPARLDDGVFIASDGAGLPHTVWRAKGEERAAIIALHGFNDYRHAFDWSAPAFAEAGITVHAYDQRGFGETANAGRWSDHARMAADALELAALLKHRKPARPVFLLGESMGAAVAVTALSDPSRDDPVAGAILVSPAAWGWSEMNIVYRAGLWLAAHIAPGWRLTGEGLERTPTDNRAALIRMSRDPHVIKATRVGTIYGLVGLMQAALDHAPTLQVPVLAIYGQNDEIVPRHAIEALLDRLPAERLKTICYASGWHLLLRDLGRQHRIEDIMGFISNISKDGKKNEKILGMAGDIRR
mgnify:CR=1 FL=1